MDRTVAAPVPGRVLEGRYLVGPPIARGGMATVHEATDLRLNRVVALKVVHRCLADDAEFADRLVKEAHAAARLSHPNVVAVYDQGRDGDTLFLAMEYVPGTTLRDLIRQEAPLPPSRALALLDPILTALAAAHGAGIVHRDVKPENVLLTDDGRVKVADFGLARAISADTQHSATVGVLIGTVSYLAPELVVTGDADARCDVYAAGIVLYELLTGRKPHVGDSPISVAYQHVHADVPAPSASAPGIPPYVDALVARATARDRAQRPVDARVLRHQLRRVRAALDDQVPDDAELTAELTPLPELRDDPGTPQAFPRAGHPAVRRRGRRRGGLLTLLVLLAVAAGAGGWYYTAGRYVTAPGVVNLSQTQARSRLEAAGLRFAVGRRAYSEVIPAGAVIRTDPPAGEDVLPGAAVTAVVSRGPERHAVPELRGLQAAPARRALARAHLSAGDVVRRFSQRVREGVVLASDPQAGTKLRPAAAVDVVVSSGPRPIQVPDLTGTGAARAEATLTDRGLDVATTARNSATVPAGDVVAQVPNRGTLFRGDTVRLVVSKGPVMVPVPIVKGTGLEEATRLLAQAGLAVRTTRSRLYVGLQYVVATDPAQGSLVPRGSLVTLYLV